MKWSLEACKRRLPDCELHSYPVARADEAGRVWEAVGSGDGVLDVQAGLRGGLQGEDAGEHREGDGGEGGLL